MAVWKPPFTKDRHHGQPRSERFDAPTFAENTVNAAPQIIDSSVTVSDVDGDLANSALIVTGIASTDRVVILAGSQVTLTGFSLFYDPDGAGVQPTIPIGSFTGGVGTSLIINFNANATAGIIQAVIQSLAFGTCSDAPAPTRNLSITLYDAAGNASGQAPFTVHDQLATDFDTITQPTLGQSALVDLDGDGDLDIVTGDLFTSTPLYYENIGSATEFHFVQTYGADNPLGGIAIAGGAPTFGDLDGDGDLDMMIGQGGTVLYYRNEGTAQAPAFALQIGASNPASSIWGGGGATYARPVLVDYDGDGDLDVVAGWGSGTVQYFRNDGTATSPTFTRFFGAGNPFAAVVVSGGAAPALIDADNDGDLDLVVGRNNGRTSYFENTGTSYVSRSGAANPFVTRLGSNYATPTVGDIDGDGDLDVLFQTVIGFRIYENNGHGGVNLPINITAEPDPIFGDDDGQTIGGTSGDDLIQGLGGDDLLDSGAGDDTLEGGDGNDYLRGGTGADAMFGGVGDDFYVVDDAGDTTDETGGDGTDLVHTTVSWTLGAGFENLTLAAPGRDVDGTGNALDNTINGNSFDNRLNGGSGEDTLLGGGGADILEGEADDDYIDGGAQNDELYGGGGNDILDGGAGADILDGQSGVDAMTGGAGNDIYFIDEATDSVIETQAGAVGGTDTVHSTVDWVLGANLEHLILDAAGDIDGTGNTLRNTITGNLGANTIYAGDEIDTVDGGGGDDSLYGENGNDVLSGAAGFDNLYGGSGNDTLHGGDSSDNLWGDIGNDVLYGDGGNDALIGQDGNDYLDGGAGADILQGGAGNDTYVIDSSSDGISESTGGGTDLILSPVGLSMHLQVENLTLTGSGDTHGVGNALANVMTGNSGDNMLNGWSGADTLSGNDGADTLVGDLGNDVISGGAGDDNIFGGAGSDRLTGGGGKDGFHFTSEDIQLSSMGGVLERDHIFDLDFAGGDYINISYIDADASTADVNEAFHFVAKFTKAAGEATLRYVASTDITTLELDVDGDGKADLRVAIVGDHSGSTGNEWTGSSDADGGWYL